MENTTNTDKKTNRFKEFFAMNEVAGYFFRKKDPNRPKGINLTLMHGINKISIVIFLLAFLFWLYKRLFM